MALAGFGLGFIPGFAAGAYVWARLLERRGCKILRRCRFDTRSDVFGAAALRK
jgi:hypothetical protein